MLKILFLGVLFAAGGLPAQAKIHVCVQPNGRVEYSVAAGGCGAAAPVQTVVRTPIAKSAAQAPARSSAAALTTKVQAEVTAGLPPLVVLDNVLARPRPVALSQNYNLAALANHREHKRIKILLTELDKEKQIIKDITLAKEKFSGAPGFESAFRQQLSYHYLNVNALTAELKNLNFFF